MKKKILVIFTGPMDAGGVESSLLGLLNSFDYDKYDVDLFLYAHHGPLFSLIDQRACLLPEVKDLAYLRESFMAKLKHGSWYAALLRVIASIKSKFTEIDMDQDWAKVMRRCEPKLDKHYDLALSFFLPCDFMIEKVDADIKVGWIHTDYNGFNIDIQAL